MTNIDVYTINHKHYKFITYNNMSIIQDLSLRRGMYIFFAENHILYGFKFKLHACNMSVTQTNFRLGRRLVQVSSSGK